MPLFKVLLHGKRFPGVILGKSDPIGFYATRFVQAPNAREAEAAALVTLRTAPELQLAPEHRAPDAEVFIEDLMEVSAETEQKPNSGFTFYENE
jgi:hypothetical protein